MNKNKKATILIGIVGAICLFSAIAKICDENFTIGGQRFRTKFWSSMFFIILATLAFTSMGLIKDDC